VGLLESLTEYLQVALAVRALGDVDRHADDGRDRPLVVEHRLVCRLEDRPPDVVGLGRPLARQRALDGVDDPLAAGHDVEGRLPYEFAGVEGEVDQSLAPAEGEHAVGVKREHDQRHVRDDGVEPFVLAFECGPGAAFLDSVRDPVCQDGELFEPRFLLQVVGHAGGDGLAGDRFRPPPGKKNERQVRVRLADGFEKLDTVHAGHVVVADDAVDAGTESLQSRLGAGRRFECEPLVLASERLDSQLGEILVVLDTEHSYRLCRLPGPGGPFGRGCRF